MKLEEIIKTKKIEIDIPGSEEKIVVQIKTDLPWKDWNLISENKDTGKAGLITMIKYIESWNIENDTGGIAEINEDNLMRLPAFVVIPIKNGISEIDAEYGEKKTN